MDCVIISAMQQISLKLRYISRIFWLSLFCATLLVIAKFYFHAQGWEPIEQSSLHNAAVSSVIFVMGFLLSAIISDYKESERIPAIFAANLEDMYDDAKAIHESYPVFDLPGYKKQLRRVAQGFSKDLRHKSYDARVDIRGLHPYWTAMEKGKVPPNFVVKLKQQQTALLQLRHRVDYIQRIRFIPSATILARTMVVLILVLLLLTNVDPFYGSMAIIGIISYVLIFMLLLIDVISLPFHDQGKTRDDVSLFLLENTAAYLGKKTDL